MDSYHFRWVEVACWCVPMVTVLFDSFFPPLLAFHHVRTFEGIHYIVPKFIRDKDRKWVS